MQSQKQKIKINNKIETGNLWYLMHQFVSNNFNSHALNSMNDFYLHGIEKIIKDVFKIKVIINNVRNKTPEDREIASIEASVVINNVRLKSPVTAGFNSGHEKMLFPVTAHIEDRTYSSNLYIDATVKATAYLRDGNEKTRTAEINNFRLASIPTMVGTILCNTYGKSRETLIQMREDPNDPKTYFIKSGKEWNIDNVESVAFNQRRIFNNYWRSELQRLEFISKPGDTYENSKQIIIRYMNNGAITVEIVSGNMRNVHFPFYLIFRMMGWTTDKEIFDHILGRFIGYPETDQREREENDRDPIFKKMYQILVTAMDANYDTKNYKFNNAYGAHSQMESLTFAVNHLPKEIFKNLDLTREDHLQQAVNSFQIALDNDILPHCGLTDTARSNKMRFLAHLIKSMLKVTLGILEPTDRDSYTTKRVHTPGISLAKIFKTYYNSAFVGPFKSQIEKDFSSMSFNSVNLRQSLETSVHGADFERLLMQSITSGNQATLKINKNRTIINRLSSEHLDRKNGIKVISTIRNVIAPDNDSSRGSDRAKEMRMPHPTSYGFICPIQSETGRNVGLKKQITISASITSYGSSELIKNMLLEDVEFIMRVETVHPYDVNKFGSVFVNGDLIGYTASSSALVQRYMQLRREFKLDRHTTIEWDNTMNEVYFWIDYGRMIRPVIIVYNNIRDYRAMGLSHPAMVKDFVQGVGVTDELIEGLKTGRLTMEDLFKMNIIEYLTPQEQTRMLIAPEIGHVIQEQNNPLVQYTHCDIAEGMFGISALTGPLSNYNQTTRNTFQTSQVKQTCGYYAHNWPFRFDKDAFLQYQTEEPLMYTRVNNLKGIGSNGANTIVCIGSYTSYNEEDSVAVCKAVYESTKYGGCWNSYDKIELEKNEMFCNPDISKTTGIKSYADYSKLGKNGIVPIGTVVKKNDVIVGKVKRLPKNVAEEKKVEFVDQSLIYKNEFPSIVHNVVIAKDDDATTFCKVAFRSPKPITIGDKFSARSGQKGVCGLIIKQEDMPFTRTGITPDIIMNPHSIPTRMTMGQIYESVIGKICCQEGVMTDGTTFRNIDQNHIISELKRLGLDYYGRERLFCGKTGTWINSMMFMGPVYYQRLQKFVVKSIYSIDIGPTDIITRQPLDGKANQGGLRISELQRDVLLAHGCSRFFGEKFFNDSDDFVIYMCRCGTQAVVNEALGLYKCIQCQDGADICAINTSWSSKTFLMELDAMHIGMKFELEPYTFYNNEA